MGEPERPVTVRKDDANIYEILGGAFEMEEFPAEDKLQLITNPFKMEDGAVFKFERVKTIAKMSLDYITWDNRLLRFGVDVSQRQQSRKSLQKHRRKLKNNSRMRSFTPCSREVESLAHPGRKLTMS
jgi:hypothetical protein